MGFRAWLIAHRRHLAISLSGLTLAAIVVVSVNEVGIESDPSFAPGRGTAGPADRGAPAKSALRPVPHGVEGGDKVKKCSVQAAAPADIGEWKTASDFAGGEALLREASDRLSKRGSSYDRALLAFLAMVSAGNRAQMELLAKRPDCIESDDCRNQSFSAAERAGREYREALVSIALASNRGDVYGFAFSACRSIYKSPSQGPCDRLSAEQWARLEPENAIPWLYVADAANRRGDLNNRNEAMFRASIARSSDSHASAFQGLLRSQEFQDQSLEIQGALDLACGMAIFIDVPPYQEVFQYCSSNAVKDPNRHQVCDDLANMLTERSDSLVSMSIGAKLAERVGWPPEKVSALRNRKDAIMEMVSTRAPTDSWSCEGLRSYHSWTAEFLRDGELSMYRRLVEASGQSEAELARHWRERQQRRADLANSAEGDAKP